MMMMMLLRYLTSTMYLKRLKVKIIIKSWHLGTPQLYIPALGFLCALFVVRLRSVLFFWAPSSSFLFPLSEKLCVH